LFLIIFLFKNGKILIESFPPIEVKIAFTSLSAKASLISLALISGLLHRNSASILAVGYSFIFNPYSVKTFNPFS
jgi:hypothetical protein